VLGCVVDLWIVGDLGYWLGGDFVCCGVFGVRVGCFVGGV